MSEDLEETLAPGHKPSWVREGDEIWWGVSREFERSIGLSPIYQYRPRYAQALAMLRRASGTHLHNNLPSYNAIQGWSNYSFVLGKEEDWDPNDLPSEAECMTAYMIQFQIHLITGFGIVAAYSSLRLGAYAYAKRKSDVTLMQAKWEDPSLRVHGELAFPFEAETNAILATCAVKHYDALRRFIGVKYATTAGPLVWAPINSTVFPKW
jgi:hypothetical protein